MDMIFTIGAFTSLFFFVLLLNKKNKSLPDLILAIWMLVISIHLTSTYININGFWETYPHLIGITAPFPLFYGPLLYLYVKYSFKDYKKLQKQDYLHFLPLVVSYLYMFRFYFFYTAEQKRLVDKGLIEDFSTFSNIMVLYIIISTIAYAIFAFGLLRKYKRMIERNFSNMEHINLNWLKSFILGVAIIFITVGIVLVSRDILDVSYPFNPEFIFYSMIVFAVLSLGYSGIRHENVFTDNTIVEVEEDITSYKKSSLKNEMATEKHEALIKMMIEEKPYLETNLTLNSLAERLDLSLHHLSQIINQFEGHNFNDFVNKYRVEEFIDRASKDKHYSFLAIALDSGFNSKSTFNSVFKKHKGVTPSKFMSSHLTKTT